MSPIRFDKSVIFVGGAPRSGTTVTHALICTSSRTNRYCPEASFLKGLFQAYSIGLYNWSTHTAAFYPSKEAFSHQMRNHVRESLAAIDRALGCPQTLCIKDPLLTPLFYWVHKLLGEQAKLVTVVRNPADIVRSRQDVEENHGRCFTEEGARAVTAEINLSYEHLAVRETDQAGFALRYEDLANPKVLADLRVYTNLPDIESGKMWVENRQFSESDLKNPWFSPKYHRPLSLEKRLSPLSSDLQRVVNETCGMIIERFNYGQQE